RHHLKMAAPAKRAKPEEFSSSHPELEKLKSWLSNEKIKVDSKVSIVKDLCCAQYGMIAVEEIPADHKFLSIPRTSLLCPENCGIGDLLEREKKTLKSESRWVPLLLAILYEYLNPESRWRTYLDVCPDYSQLDHPMFWTDDDLKKELRGTGVIESVKQDLINIKKEFNEIVGPFIKNHQSVFPKEAHSIDLYKKLVGFVMGYSFTEPCQFKNEGKELVLPPPVMVPAADILNHVSQNNAKLDFGKDALDMITIKPIKKGDEIFNTYGELTNGQLLHMYGFSERSNNIYDAVEIPMDLFLEIFKEDISEE
ncbi:SETD6 (predicted), partial [Pycnogonum litorale]